MFLRLTLLVMVVFCLNLSAQENYSTSLIPTELTENANAVLRYNKTDINIAARNSIITKQTRVVTVLNEYGTDAIDASVMYDETTKVKQVEALIFDKNGQQLKKVKRKEFKDRSVTAGNDITDNRILYLDYTPVSYPFTVVFTCETESENTAFLPQFSPVESVFFSTQKSEYTITVAQGLGFRYKEYNFSDVVLNKQQNGNTYTFNVENVPAVRAEDAAPVLNRVVPYVLFGLDKFHLEGVDGVAESWEAFGNWVYNSLLTGTDELPAETVVKIKGLVGTETDPLKKAKIVYKYMQGKTRYVSIQLGIGGWKPMSAKDVDRLGYGDCKALTNYTRALLKAVDVPSYYTVVYGGRRRDLNPDFVSMQGNHVILAIPQNEQLYWLECTSQIMPFGFQGNFTDDRMVLLVKPEKSELVRTHIYGSDESSQLTTAAYTLGATGNLNGSFTRVSKGLQYDDKISYTRLSQEDLVKEYKEAFPYLNNLKLGKPVVNNNYDIQQITEEIALEVPAYCNNSGGRLIFAVNAFNQNYSIPARYRSRKLPLEIGMGYTDKDEVTINLPEGFVIEALPQNVVITDKFGEYRAEFSAVGTNQILYKRTLQMNSGNYPKEDYEKYRDFREKIARNDNAKAVLVKK